VQRQEDEIEDQDQARVMFASAPGFPPASPNQWILLAIIRVPAAFDSMLVARSRTSTSAWGNEILKGASVVRGCTSILSPTMVNDFRFGSVDDFSYAQQPPVSLASRNIRF